MNSQGPWNKAKHPHLPALCSEPAAYPLEKRADGDPYGIRTVDTALHRLEIGPGIREKERRLFIAGQPHSLFSMPSRCVTALILAGGHGEW
jgi:hypothetical protein